MSFRRWLEAQFDPYASTVDISPEEMEKATGDAGTPTTIAQSQPQQPDPNSTLAQVEKSLGPLDIDSIEQGYSGTPEYSAPEQFFSTNPRQPDFYQLFLKDLPELFPNNEQMIKEMLDEWLLFKSELLRRLGKRQYMDDDHERPLYPIHFQLPLRTLRMANQSFAQVKRLLETDNDPELQGLKERFYKLFAKHSTLQKMIEEPLVRQLHQARNNPDSFTQTGVRRRPPAA